MQTKLILAGLAATLLLPISSARAQVIGCVSRAWLWTPGVTHASGHTLPGTPCQLGLGEWGGIIESLRIVARPSHGILGTAAPEANRRYLAYVPAAGFAGHDRFELYVQVIPPWSRTPLTTRFIVDMDITP